MFRERRIKGNFTQSSSCQVCQLAKIRNRPHSQELPRADAPFLKIHMDTLQINPPTCRGYKYVLVLIDDFSRFNRIYLLSEKAQAEERIKTYLMEIMNKLDITPAYLHTDCRGEFSSQLFLNHLASQGISPERGPPESPQTNGVSERFNQTLLSKIRCLLGQSNIPISYWDEAALHASLLLNMLPHKHLNMESHITVLKRKKSLIEPEIDLNRLVPFGIRITTEIVNPTSKSVPRGEVLQALTFERPSLKIKLRVPASLSNIPEATNDSYKTENPPELASAVPTTEKLKNYDYVPYYKEAPRHISSSISQDNIVEGKRNARHSDQLLLTDTVPYLQEVNDPIEQTKWRKAMDAEFASLMCHNTKELVPYPQKPTKVIGGMWRLTRKCNENGEVYQYKACWVVLGNHQEPMLHYYETWSSVGRNETFKVMLFLVVNFNYIPYQFDIQSAFLHGEMDALVQEKQVKGYEEKGKENWVWRLMKSLYGTKQAPRMWKSKLASALSSLGLMSTWSDKSLFINAEKSLLLHVHVDDGFIISHSHDTPQNQISVTGTALSICQAPHGIKVQSLIYNQCTTKEMLTGWTDADYANVKDDGKSITGYVILDLGNPVCWLSKKQSVVAQSTTEAKYISMNICMKQLWWITFVFSDLGYGSIQPILYNDNLSAITISKQALLNTNTKHIEVRYQYVRDCVMKKLVTVV
ncbi:hypothetical protein O181_052069 [Austropuccinia psidii MF-1]|uniref:Integrase catalytic domain-containing protein n=1 Tax=Austropuccinia psidii MF-1 TaxID=1389203 RepID=A0A9Q3E000_9BASI|nr:hypothetical protein [Austropuccinia psidii MF-1]